MADDEGAGELNTLNSTIDRVESNMSSGFSRVDAEMSAGFSRVDAEISRLESNMSAGFSRVDAELKAAKVRDEELRALIILGFEGLAGLRQSTDARFGTVTREIREQTSLLKSVLVHVRRHVDRPEPPKLRRGR